MVVATQADVGTPREAIPGRVVDLAQAIRRPAGVRGPSGDPVKERSPLNNNRGNNRRRGRGNNRPQGGGQQLNRIDSRARGNAPQLLEKYRKLAHDAHLNGDRVTEEYYLQFADHYFRVIADTRTRQEEQRARRDDRWQDQGEEGEEAIELSGGDYQGYDQGYGRSERVERVERVERPERPERGNRDERPRDERPRDQRPREDRPRDDRPRGDDRQRDGRREREEQIDDAVEVGLPDEAADAAEDQASNIYEPAENPFVREPRGTRGLKPRREDRRPRRQDSDEVAEAPAGFDVSVLPPALGAAREDAAEMAAPDEEAPAPKRRGRKPKAAASVAADEG